MDDEKLAKTSDDQAIIDECVKRLQLAITAYGDNRQNALDDLAFIAGEQWAPQIKAQRERDGRPCLTINKLPTFLHQVTNAQRQNVPSIKVNPVNGTDVKLAEVVQGAIRHIEYASNADVCYDTAVNSAATIGEGYFRLITDYCDEDSFDQDIKFQRIANPFTVYLDPSAINPDGSDMQWAILSERISKIDFKLQYPKAECADFEMVRGMGDTAANWVTEDQYRIAEYYRIKKKAAKVVLLSNGESGFKDDLVAMPPGVTIVKERDGFKSIVEWFKLTATEVLERAEIPCKWIPVFPVYGDEINIDGKIVRSGLVRNAKDPARAYNVWMSAATEEIALRPKAKYIGAEGQFEGHEDEWARANNSSDPYLEYKPTTVGGLLAPPPMRQPLSDVPVGVIQMAMHANDDIKATTGIFDASLGAKSNETSGIAIARRDKQGEVANFHYADNLINTLRHVGRCIINMWPKVYDGQRTLAIMGVDKKVSSAPINTPLPPDQTPPDGAAVTQKIDPTSGAVMLWMNDVSEAEFSVTVSSGPSFDTLRQEAVEGMVAVGQSWPKLWEVAGDKLVRTMDWPMADEIADRLEKTLPPGLADKKEGEPENPIPPEVQQQMQQYEQAMEDLMKQVDEARAGIDKAKIDAEAKIQVAQIDREARMAEIEAKNEAMKDIEEIKGFVALLKEQLTPPPELAKEAIDEITEDEGGEEKPEKPDMNAILLQAMQQLAKPRRKRMAIQAPSGAVYQGAIIDGEDEEQQIPQQMPPEGMQ